MSDDEDDLEKRRRILEIYRQNVLADSVQKHHQAYINHLHERLDQWKAETDRKIKQFIQEKIEEIDQLYEEYSEEFHEKYSDITQKVEQDDTSADIDNQIANFQNYCQSNTIENCLRLESKIFSDEQLNENIQLELVIQSDPPAERPMERREQRRESPVEEQTIEPSTIAIRQNRAESSDSSDEDKTIDSPPSTSRRTPVQSPPPANGPTRRSPSPTLARATETFSTRRPVELLAESPVVEQTIRSSEPIIRKRLLQSPVEQNLIEPSHSPVEERAIRSIESSTEKPLHSPIQHARRIEPIQLVVRNRSESISSARTSSAVSSIPSQDHPRQFTHSNQSELKRLSNASQENPPKPSHRRTSNDEGKGLTRLYVGTHNVLTPVLVGKDRDVFNERERITEYSIDSISLPQDKQRVRTESDDEMMIVRAYKVLIRDESEYQTLSTTFSSDHEIDEDEELSNISPRFNLKAFDQINYSTIMFRKCQTEYNCLCSSTRRNELILYNSKLKVLIVLQHENHHQCRHRFYLHWPQALSSTISDITYCNDIDHFLISTRDTSRIYLFDRHLLSIIDLGQLSNDAPLRRIHSYHQTIYCILANNYLLEYQFERNYSQIGIVRKIKLFNPLDQSQDTPYHLLDVTADENYLIVLYANENDEIRLQSIYRETKKFHQDILIDTRQPINQNYIRIESTCFKGQFLYLNGSQQHLKAIDLVNYNKAKVTAIMRRHTKPTNISFLADRRLVILYEEPYFLSVHDLNSRQGDH